MIALLSSGTNSNRRTFAFALDQICEEADDDGDVDHDYNDDEDDKDEDDDDDKSG